MLTAVPEFLAFFYYVCLVCSQIVINIIEFYATVIQVRCLARYENRLNPPFLHKEMSVTSQECYSIFIHVMCLSF